MDKTYEDARNELLEFLSDTLRLTQTETNKLDDLLDAFARAYAWDAIDYKFNEGRYRS